LCSGGRLELITSMTRRIESRSPSFEDDMENIDLPPERNPLSGVWADRHTKLGREFNDIQTQFSTIMTVIDDVAARTAQYGSDQKLKELDQAVRTLIDESEKVNFYPSALEQVGLSDRVENRDEFHKLVDAKEREYDEQTEWNKYGNHTHYVDFKKTVWTAKHPEKPHPRMHRYFADANVSNEESDEDIQIESITQNLRCPLTLQYYEEPMKARCGHIFDKSAIYDMLNQAAINGQSLPCPQSGCNHLVTRGELKLDRPTLRLVESAKEKEREVHVEAMSDEGDAENDGEFITV